jgi:hypothetical protein
MTTMLSRTISWSRAGIAAGLAVVAAVLFFMDQSGPLPPAERAASLRGDLRSVNTIVDTVLGRHGIAPDQVRSWQVHTPDRKFLRTERRVMVPPDFISVKFNHDLNEALDGTGARVVATERTKENTVTTHIKQGSTIMESITFVMNRRPAGTPAAATRPNPRKHKR